MKIKVCGMKYPDNIKELNKLPVDFAGMIFYEKSPRYAAKLNPEDIRDLFRGGRKRVGVFVNADMDYIIQMADKFSLDLIQLHGDESPDFCKELNKRMPVIKAFSISESSDFEKTKAYDGLCGYFLFDTKTPQYGGSGRKFDWNILDEYKGNTPFILSGGISVDDAETIKNIKHPQFFGIDLNSRFETEPGRKDIILLQQFIKRLKDE
ncbi:phosphoribosylanthranilate isomerase [Dysgonomonas sp. 521]|uniref:phosphoribosylanthranilate isomerase n=1 Tax=Dysgonomonas sp. 521 TaxID=2302932 RepID=UPI0013D43B04|nr:phosphoribosylanthranilate isomerase [Dysgonomonas sp. 521]NDV93710.1 phosphoribosylanthranilate isomerase [Dysgonomonas sp. 521]